MKQRIIIIVITLLVTGMAMFFIFRPEPIRNFPSKGTDIIAFGDSLVVGAGSTNGNDFVSLLSQKTGKQIINLGNGGDTTADGIARLSQLDRYNPKVVLLLLGGNDHLKKVPIAVTRKNLTNLIENIEQRGAVVLLLGVRGGLINDPFDTMFENLSETHHTAYVPDVLGGLFGNSQYMHDKIHPNDAGYRIIAERIYPVLISVMQ